jgi:hypothetical protein
VAAGDLADEEDEWAALAATGTGGAVIQAYPVGQVVRRSGRDVSLQLPSFGVVTGSCPDVSFDFPRWREVVVFAN